MVKKNSQNIKCDVDTCVHNDTDEHMCDLKEIQVGCDTEIQEEAEIESDTVCNSFEKEE